MWPRDAGKRTIAVNSNHEMYSGGFGYFKLALPAIGQKSSYLAFENKNWLFVVLDTAYVDHDMDNEQVAWLNLVLKQSREANGGVAKKLVLFSHQQPYSRLDSQGPRLQNALRHLLTAQGDHRVVLGPRAPVRDLRQAPRIRPARPLPGQRRHSRGAKRRSEESERRSRPSTA